MSNTVLRRNSSKQGLQNLLRLTAQRSVEDAEEVERERRRRARQASRWTNDGSLPADNEMPSVEVDMLDLKPRSSPSLEEDEGFSDWTQRQERRRQRHMEEVKGKEDEDKEEVTVKTIQASVTSTSRLQRGEQEDRSKRETQSRRDCEGGEMEEGKRKKEEISTSKSEETQRPNTEEEKRKEVQNSSKVFLQEPNHNTTGEEVTSHMSNKTKRSTRAMEPEEAEAILEVEQHLEKIRHSLQQKESQELEQLRHQQAKAAQALEELQRRREERCQVWEEEEHRREEQEQQQLAKEEEERRRRRKDIERRRLEAAERIKNFNMSSMDGDEMFSPFSPKAPTHKITETTELLNRSLKKSNSFKKTQPIVLTNIDDKMEQYAHAVENFQEPRSMKASLSDLLSSPEVVTKKNLFEAGDAWSPSRAASCKDTDGLKVGVASLITHWVKGPCDSSRQSSCRPTDVKPGDVMQKKNMWEVIGDSSGRSTHRAKVSAAAKKYKFVVTGHGKYEKICVADEDGGHVTNRKSDDLYHDY